MAIKDIGKQHFIRTHLLIMTISVALPIACFAGAVTLWSAHLETSLLESTLKAGALALAADVSRELDVIRHAGDVLGSGSNARQSDDIALLRTRANVIATNFGVRVLLSDSEGTVLVDSGEIAGGKPSRIDNNRLRSAFSSQRPQVSGLLGGPESENAFVAVDAPLLLGWGREYLLSLLVPQAVFQSMLTKDHLDPEWNASILDAEGHLVARRYDAARFVGHAESAEFIGRAVADDGLLNTASVDGARIRSAYARTPFGWIVAVSVPLRVFDAPARQSLYIIGVGALAALLLASVVALWAGWRISHPIAALSRAAFSVGRGIAPTAAPRGIREITSVSTSLHDAYEKLMQREQGLRESEARYRAIFDSALDGMVVIDDCGTIMSVNAAAQRLTGYTAEDMLGHDVGVLMQPEMRAVHGGYIDHYLKTGEAKIIGLGRDVEIRRRDGVTLPVHLSVVEWQVGDRKNFTGTLRDISTERNEQAARAALVEQLHQSQKMEAIGQLSGGIAHDFNNLLLAINLNVGILRHALATNPAMSELLDEISLSTEQARTLIAQLLAFGRRQTLQPTVFEVNDVIWRISPILRRVFEASIEVREVLGEHVWPIFADRNQLETALLNLAINARDAMPAGGRLIVETANATLDSAYIAQHPDFVPGEYAMIAISDTGIGMTQEQVSRAFEPFYTTKNVGEGTGLGLSQVYGFARQSGGHVSIYSEPGNGTTVKLFLPRATSVSVDETPEDTVLPPVGNEKILLVEDTAVVRAAVLRSLQDLGYSVIGVATAAEGLEVLENDPQIDLVLTDIVLAGGMSGVDLATAARRLRPGIKVLLTSGYTQGRAGQPDIAGIGTDLISKPYSLGELALKLRHVLARLPTSGVQQTGR